MSCEAAKKYVADKIQSSEAAKYATQGQIETAINACCSDVTSKGCVEAVGVLVTAGGCAAVTQGACLPCCQAAAGLVVPLIVDGLGAVVGVAGDAYDALKGLLGLTSCDYDPAFNQAAAAHVAAVEKMGASLNSAWTRLRVAYKLPAVQKLPPAPAGSRPFELMAYLDPQSGMWVPFVPETRVWPKTVFATWWTHMIVSNAKILFGNGTTWWKRGDGSLYLTPHRCAPGTTSSPIGAAFKPMCDAFDRKADSNEPADWFSGKWNDWPCKKADEFAKITTAALADRLNLCAQAVEMLGKSMSGAFVAYSRNRPVTLASLRISKFRPRLVSAVKPVGLSRLQLGAVFVLSALAGYLVISKVKF